MNKTQQFIIITSPFILDHRLLRTPVGLLHTALLLKSQVVGRGDGPRCHSSPALSPLLCACPVALLLWLCSPNCSEPCRAGRPCTRVGDQTIPSLSLTLVPFYVTTWYYWLNEVCPVGLFQLSHSPIRVRNCLLS